MSLWDDIAASVADLDFGDIDVSKVVQVVQGIVEAAPAIQSGVTGATPYIMDIIMLIQRGGNPTDAEWAAMRTRLDAGSAALQKAAHDPETPT